jgi:uncharacterized protein (TIRG00374 family)
MRFWNDERHIAPHVRRKGDVVLNPKSKRPTKTQLKYVACVALIVITLMIANPGSLVHAIVGVDLYLLGLVVGLYIINLVVKSYRWKILMKRTGAKIPFRLIFKNYTFAQAVNNITPGMVGDATRIYGVSSDRGVDLGRGTASVVTERLMDLTLTTTIAITGVIMLAPMLMNGVLGQLNRMIGIAVAANLIIICVLLRPTLLQKVGNGLVKIVSKVVPGRTGQNLAYKLSGFIDSFTTAMAPSDNGTSRKTLVGAGVLTVVVWANEIARVYLIMAALGTSVDIAAIMIVTSVSALSGILLVAGSSNIFVSSAVFSAVGVSAGVAAGAGVLSALTSIWLSVPISVIAMLMVDRRTPKDRVSEELQIEQHQG